MAPGVDTHIKLTYIGKTCRDLKAVALRTITIASTLPSVRRIFPQTLGFLGCWRDKWVNPFAHGHDGVQTQAAKSGHNTSKRVVFGNCLMGRIV